MCQFLIVHQTQHFPPKPAPDLTYIHLTFCKRVSLKTLPGRDDEPQANRSTSILSLLQHDSRDLFGRFPPEQSPCALVHVDPRIR
jgi:hypothetical protein